MDEKSYITVFSAASGSVEVNRQKNRLYVNLESGQEDMLASSAALEELHELSEYLSHGFTMLFDVRQGECHHAREPELLCDVMNLLLEGGLRKLAEVHAGPRKRELPQDCRKDRLDADVQRAVFASYEEAEAWLDR